MKLFRTPFFSLLTAILCMSLGCGRSHRSTAGGTPGQVVTASGHPLIDVLVRFHSHSEAQSAEKDDAQEAKMAEGIAMGSTDLGGNFRLTTPDAKSAVWLTPGRYRVTIESMGSVPYFWNESLNDPRQTPLFLDWNGQPEQIELQVPDPIEST